MGRSVARTPARILDPVADLARRLARAATPRARAFWTRYLRGSAKFRGVPMGKVRSTVQTWWSDHELAAHPIAVGKKIALSLIEQRLTEDKLAGILVLQEMLGDGLRISDLPAFARAFTAGHLADWNVVDWFSVKVLGSLLEREDLRQDAARAIVQWRHAESTWQRRAACIAFVGLAARGEAALPGLTTLLLGLCAHVLWSHERTEQTAVGWLLRELSRAEPDRVDSFFRRSARLMTKECARASVSRLPALQRAELLAYHKRATTIRRS